MMGQFRCAPFILNGIGPSAGKGSAQVLLDICGSTMGRTIQSGHAAPVPEGRSGSVGVGCRCFSSLCQFS